jgi:hypothetical protein
MHDSEELSEQNKPGFSECGHKEEQRESTFHAKCAVFISPYPPAQPGGEAVGCQLGRRIQRPKES